jgi:hypothetical protein
MSDSISSITDNTIPKQRIQENSLDLTPHIIEAFLIVFANNLSQIQNFNIQRKLGKHVDQRFYSYQFFVYIDNCECLILTVGKNEDQMLFLDEFKMGTDDQGNPCCTLPTDKLLDVVTLVALFSNMKYISIVDDSMIIIGKNRNKCNYNLALFYILETGNSWYDIQGFVSENVKEEHKYNRKLLDKPLRFFHTDQQSYIRQIIYILFNSYNESFPYGSIHNIFNEMTLSELMVNHIIPHKHKITTCDDPMYQIIMCLQDAFMFLDDKTEAIETKVFYYNYENRKKDLSKTVIPQTFDDYVNNHNLTKSKIQNEIGAISQFLKSQNENITYQQSVDDMIWAADTDVDISSIFEFITEYSLTHDLDVEMELDELESAISPLSDWILEVRERVNNNRKGGIKTSTNNSRLRPPLLEPKTQSSLRGASFSCSMRIVKKNKKKSKTKTKTKTKRSQKNKTR